MLQATYRLAEAEPLMRRCLEITRKFRESTGYEHASEAGRIERYRQLLQAMGWSAAAAAAIAISGNSLPLQYPEAMSRICREATEQFFEYNQHLVPSPDGRYRRSRLIERDLFYVVQTDAGNPRTRKL